MLLDEIRRVLPGAAAEVIRAKKAEPAAAAEAQAAAAASGVSPARPGFGDASSNVAFLLAGPLGDGPGRIAKSISDAYNGRIEEGGLVLRSVPHPSGYVNFEADWQRLSALILPSPALGTFGDVDLGGGTTVTVEHTSVNPNKALHIGHVRNVVVGDSVSRILKKSGHRVNVLNYVDDSGLQVADIIVGFRHLGFPLEPPPGKKFAQYCGDDVYVKTTGAYESDPSLEAVRRDILKEIEDGNTGTATLAAEITRRVLSDQLRTCWNLSVHYDCLNFESQIIRSGMWADVFERLKRMGLVELDRSGGRNDGCWVVRDARAPGAPVGGDGDGDSGDGGDGNGHGGDDGHGNGRDPERKNRDKVIVRSNGTATYIAKDIPYAAWKLGLLEDPFQYAVHTREQPGSGAILWQTTLGEGGSGGNGGAAAAAAVAAAAATAATAAEAPSPPGRRTAAFAGERVITVIDSRQSGLQKIITDLMGRFRSSKSAYVHLAYESVTLSPETARALGVSTDKRHAQMSGRRGLYVDADSVYDTLCKKASAETLKRHPCMPAEDVDRISHAISVGTIRYEMARQDLDKIITFDMARSLSLEGDTASYIQYAGARASRILEKAGRAPSDAVDFGMLTEGPELNLIRLIGSFEIVVSDAARNLSPKVVARYCHDLAVGFNMFYERHRVLGLEDERLEDARLYLVYSFRLAVTRALDLIGVPSPDVM